MKTDAFIVFCVAVFFWFGAFPAAGSDTTANNQRREVLSLAGQWKFSLDADRRGDVEGFYKGALADTVDLPGSTDENRKGTRNTREPNYNRLSRIYEYTGPAWYQKEITIPASWKNKRIVLFLERCHWQTKVYIDDQIAGMRDSLCVPHIHDLSSLLNPGKHRLTVCVDNTPKHFLGPFASSISEETQTNWNGIIGRMELIATDKVWVEDVQVYPDVDRKSAQVRVDIGNMAGRVVSGTLHIQVSGDDGTIIAGVKKAFVSQGATTSVKTEVQMSDKVRLWDEFSPNLCNLTVSLEAAGGQESYLDKKTTTFGMRKLTVNDNKQFVLNDRTIFLRGNLECCIFPLTGYPPTDIDSWERIFDILESYGLNHLRFHSWCPPKAAFAAADEAGFLIQVGAPRANARDAAQDKFIAEEVVRILKAYGNHPSFGFLSMGNELGGDNKTLSDLVARAKELDSRHYYVGSTGTGPLLSEDTYMCRHEVRGGVRPATNWDHSENKLLHNGTLPLISHEIAQWAVFPDLAEIDKYTGVLRARNYGLIKRDLQAKHMVHLAEKFTHVTGKFSVLLYKEEIECLLRTRNLAGFQILDLHDYPGTGTALVGLMDVFWDSKGFITPKEFRQFCSETVPLLRMKKRVYTSDEVFWADAEIVHYGAADIAEAKPRWKITDEHREVIASGGLPVQSSIPAGKRTGLGRIESSFRKVTEPSKLTVTLYLDGTDILNSWEIWVYPRIDKIDIGDDIIVKETWNEDTINDLNSGESVLLLARPPRALKGRFLPVFWSPVWFRHNPGTMSILCDPDHPLFSQFPTDAYSNWQWYDLKQNSRVMILDEAPSDFFPVVQLVDQFNTTRKLGSIFETKVGKGKLLVCSIDLKKDIDKRPAAKQLLYSIIEYMKTDAFDPQSHLSISVLDEILGKIESNLPEGTKVTADTEENDFTADLAIDGDISTFWCTQWRSSSPAYPHYLQLEFPKETQLRGLTYAPRADGNTNGWISKYQVFTSTDGNDWGKATAEGAFEISAEKKTIIFDEARSCRYIRFVALEGMNAQPWAAIAEIDVILEMND